MKGEKDGPDTENRHDKVKDHVELWIDDPVGEVLEYFASWQAVMAPQGWNRPCLVANLGVKEISDD